MFNLKPLKMKPGRKPKSQPTANELIKEIKRRTRRVFTSEEKIRIVLEGLRGEESIAALCRKYNIHQNLYFKWSKDFMEAGKKRLSGDTVREASTDEVKDLKDQNSELKQELAELYLQNKMLKKNLKGYI
jgi:transposase